MSRVCLLVVFNHKYNKNIPVLENIYRGERQRFSDVYYLVPFIADEIEGIDASRIIRVNESSFCFQGYFPQAYDRIKNISDYTHFVIIGDDLILNPKLSKSNIIEELGLGKDESYIKKIVPFGKSGGDKSNKLYSILSPFCINSGVSWKNEIPSCTDAKARCRNLGLEISSKLPFSFLLKKGYCHPKYIMLTIQTLLINRGRKLPYPLFKAYSDFLVIDAKSMKMFCHYSGVMAAMNIFVETAIPTAMAMACSKIVYEKDRSKYFGVEKWEADIITFEEKYRRNLNELYEGFGDDVLYYHPVKLSKWHVRSEDSL